MTTEQAHNKFLMLLNDVKMPNEDFTKVNQAAKTWALAEYQKGLTDGEAVGMKFGKLEMVLEQVSEPTPIMPNSNTLMDDIANICRPYNEAIRNMPTLCSMHKELNELNKTA